MLAALLPDGIGRRQRQHGARHLQGGRRGTPDASRAMADSDGAARRASGRRCSAAPGATIALALEPEPCCFLETIEETVAFFEDHLLGRCERGDRRAALTGLVARRGRDALRRHLGVCFDVCHAAVEFEDPADAFARLAAAGIRVAKLQLSSALRLPQVERRDRADALAPSTTASTCTRWCERRNGAITRYVDLAPAFAALRGGKAGGEWRVHCHVPVFLEVAGRFHSTQPTLQAVARLHRAGFVAPHLEVETYTWDVLPAELRRESRADAIARELRWVLQELA